MPRPVTGILLLGSLVCLLTLPRAAAQEEEGFFPPQQIGAGGGAAMMLAQISLPALDARFADLGLETLPEWMPLYGAEGIVNIGHLLIGYAGYGGRVRSEATAGGIYRESQVWLNYSTIVVGWVKAAGKFKLSLGGAIGGGSLHVRAIRRPASGSSWSDLWAPYSTSFSGPVSAADLETATHLEGTFFSLAPRVGVRWWFMPFLAFDLGVSYRLGTIGAGKMRADGRRVPGSPEFDLSGMSIRAGLFLGF